MHVNVRMCCDMFVEGWTTSKTKMRRHVFVVFVDMCVPLSPVDSQWCRYWLVLRMYLCFTRFFCIRKWDISQDFIGYTQFIL
jgi:hypothetical protein